MILCCGEALIDMLPRQTVAGDPAFQPFIGGSIFNTSIALARLGATTAFYGGLSTDFFGDMLRDGLRASGVDVRFAAVSDRSSTLAFVRFVDGQPSYAFVDEGSAGRMLAERDLPNLPPEVTALHCGGIVLAAEPCGTTFEMLAARAKDSRVITFDPNIRPSLVRDPDSYRARIDRIVAMADVVKLSSEDLDWLMPGAAVPDVAARWLARGPRLVVVTAGKDGATAFANGMTVRQGSPAVEVADTIGAGDTFMAGLICALQDQGLLDKAALSTLTSEAAARALAFAMRAATITVSRPGCDPPWRRELADD